jgi:hypothetical protein
MHLTSTTLDRLSATGKSGRSAQRKRGRARRGVRAIKRLTRVLNSTYDGVQVMGVFTYSGGLRDIGVYKGIIDTTVLEILMREHLVRTCTCGGRHACWVGRLCGGRDGGCRLVTATCSWWLPGRSPISGPIRGPGASW